MTISQQPLGSPFGAHSTAADVMAGIDLSGKLAVATGGHSGIGLETTRALASAGGTGVVPAPRPAVAGHALDGIARVEVASMDLAALDSVKDFAAWFRASDRREDLLFANAAIMANPETRVGPG